MFSYRRSKHPIELHRGDRYALICTLSSQSTAFTDRQKNPSSSMSLDIAQAHRYFATECFNRAWDLMETTERDADMDEQMLLLSLASLWHWTQCEDCTEQNLSIGYWQVSRVHALLGQADNAQRYAERCQQVSTAQPPFFQAYAHEAFARAAIIGGDLALGRSHLEQASTLALQVEDPQDRALLHGDLAVLRDMVARGN